MTLGAARGVFVALLVWAVLAACASSNGADAAKGNRDGLRYRTTVTGARRASAVGEAREEHLGMAPSPLSGVAIIVGTPEVVHTDASSVPDNPTNVLVVTDGVGGHTTITYTANAETFQQSYGQSVDDILSDPLPSTGLSQGPAGSIDACGAWLNAARAFPAQSSVGGNGATEEPVVRGWYHAETQCDYGLGQTHKSVAYCESTDGGKTYTKAGYPNNTVLVGAAFAPNKTTGAGDHSVVAVGDSLLMFYGFYPEWDIGVARASLADGGRPGTWFKLHNGTFSLDALAPSPSPDALRGIAGTFVAWLPNSTALLSVGESHGGIVASASADGVAWDGAGMLTLLPAMPPNWSRGTGVDELVAYSSLVSDVPAHNTLWLYYLFLRPGDGFDKRNNVRRRMRVLPLADAAGTPVALVFLAQYASVSSGDVWATTVSVLPRGTDYVLVDVLATVPTGEGVCASSNATALQLWDCYDAGNATHVLGSNSECTANAWIVLRPIGYACESAPQPLKFAAGSGEAANALPVTPLVRCVGTTGDGRARTFVVAGTSCPSGSTTGLTLGFVFAAV